MPQGKQCATCDHFAVDEHGEGYCVCKASRDAFKDCLSCVLMITHGLCGPVAKWVHWERKK